ncbi:MAG: hypothetical protein JRI25_00085 [Deltaproteobacteria bacterium]|nr:hypothetical protein [Deltaproteobacteria bacterium]
MGCDRIASDYVLHLLPRATLDQRPFADDPSVKLVLRDPVRGRDIQPLGSLADDTVTSEGMGPLQDTWAGLLLELPPDTSPTYDPSSLQAWGEAGPFTLADEGEEIEQRVLIPKFGRVGDLDLLPVGTAAFGAAVALTPRGDVLLFGGVDGLDVTSTPALARILSLEDVNGGDWRFVDTGTMPSIGGSSARYEATATLVEADGRDAVLVAGGRANGASRDDNLSTAFLLDAVTGEVLWSSEAMQRARSGHLAQSMANGRVLMVGGFEGEDVGIEPERASFEVFDPTWRAFDPGGDLLDVPARGFAVADLRSDGVLVCGGGVPKTPDPDAPRVPVDECNRISILGNVQSSAPLPEPLQYLAMAPVGDREVLACGGVPGVVDGAATATDRAWLYQIDQDTWLPLPPLYTARAMHKVLTTPDGRGIVLGGTTAGSDRFDELGAPVECVEVFDPDTRTFTEVECTATASGAAPGVSTSVRGLAFVISGLAEAGGGGRAYGVVGLGPDL